MAKKKKEVNYVSCFNCSSEKDGYCTLKIQDKPTSIARARLTIECVWFRVKK